VRLQQPRTVEAFEGNLREMRGGMGKQTGKGCGNSEAYNMKERHLW
jgi:hypothetical protein